MDFYLEFFDFLVDELLRLVEEERTSRRLENRFNSTFITSIPNQDFLESFDGFRPIPSCKYRIIEKVIIFF
jgi:hypothetical protein